MIVRQRRCESRRRGSSSPAAAPVISTVSSRHQLRRSRRARPGWRGHGPSLLYVVASVLLGTGGVGGQFVDGGDISMSCDMCECSGTSDAGTVIVFENPSSGGQVALVDGELTEVVDTSCGKSVIAAGSTVYELNGVDFGSRSLEVLEMSAGEDCRDVLADIPSDADCYSGTSSDSLSGGAELNLSVCLCTWTNESGGSNYRVNVMAAATGAGSVSIPGSGLVQCLDNGFISQLVTAVVDDSSYDYNLDLDIPGEGSSGLDVTSGPSSSAQAFICGDGSTSSSSSSSPSPSPSPSEEEVETPAPFTPEVPLIPIPVTPEQTPEPVTPTPTQMAPAPLTPTAAPEEPRSPSSSASAPLGAVIGGVVGGAALLVIGGLLLAKRRRGKKRNGSFSSPLPGAGNLPVVSDGGGRNYPVVVGGGGGNNPVATDGGGRNYPVVAGGGNSEYPRYLG